jgi:hypothetical protein
MLLEIEARRLGYRLLQPAPLAGGFRHRRPFASWMIVSEQYIGKRGNPAVDLSGSTRHLWRVEKRLI